MQNVYQGWDFDHVFTCICTLAVMSEATAVSVTPGGGTAYVKVVGVCHGHPEWHTNGHPERHRYRERKIQIWRGGGHFESNILGIF